MTKATLNLDEFPTLHRSRVYSLRLLESLTGGLAARAEALPSLSCIAAGGSVGRLESRPGSDLDSIIVQSAGNWSALECDAALSVLFACAVERGLKAPKATV